MENYNGIISRVSLIINMILDTRTMLIIYYSVDHSCFTLAIDVTGHSDDFPFDEYFRKEGIGGLCVQCASVFSQATFDPAQI